MIPRSPARQVQSVRTAFRIVAHLQDMDGVTMNQLSDQLDLAKSTVHNYLATLQSLGYVVERDGAYHLGLRFLTHGMAARSGYPLRDAVAYRLGTVARSVDQTTWWLTEELGRGLFLDVSRPEGAEALFGRVGKRSYLHTHAPGKAMLATCSEDTVRELVEYHGLPVHTHETITDVETLLAELRSIADQGYAVSDGEAALGIKSVGVAFEGPAETIHGLGVFGHSHDFSSSADQDIPETLVAAARELGTVRGGVSA